MGRLAKRGRATSRDVAARAGVNQSTVSRVLRGQVDARIPASTVERIQAAARDLNYLPDLRMRELRTGVSNRVGVFLVGPDAAGIRMRLLEGVIAGARQASLDTLVFTREISAPETEALLASDLADGLVTLGDLSEVAWAPSLAACGRPVVHAGPGGFPGIPTVSADESEVSRAIVDHLRDIGCRSAGVVVPVYQPPSLAARLAALRQEAGEAGVALQEWSDRSAEEVVAVARGRAEVLIDLEGEQRAREWLDACRDFGIGVPEDLGIVSVNSTVASLDLPVPLTSVRLPWEDLGKAAVAKLAATMRGDPEPSPGTVRPTVDVRASTRKRFSSRPVLGLR